MQVLGADIRLCEDVPHESVDSIDLGRDRLFELLARDLDGRRTSTHLIGDVGVFVLAEVFLGQPHLIHQGAGSTQILLQGLHHVPWQLAVHPLQSQSVEPPASEVGVPAVGEDT